MNRFFISAFLALVFLAASLPSFAQYEGEETFDPIIIDEEDGDIIILEEEEK